MRLELTYHVCLLLVVVCDLEFRHARIRITYHGDYEIHEDHCQEEHAEEPDEPGEQHQGARCPIVMECALHFQVEGLEDVEDACVAK